MNEAAKAKTIVELEWEVDWLEQQLAWKDNVFDRLTPVMNAMEAYYEGRGGVNDERLHDQLIEAFSLFRRGAMVNND